MAIEIAICGECGCEDITGRVACADAQLCPDCASKYAKVDAFLLRQYMMAQQAKEAESK